MLDQKGKDVYFTDFGSLNHFFKTLLSIETIYKLVALTTLIYKAKVVRIHTEETTEAFGLRSALRSEPNTWGNRFTAVNG